MMMRDFPKALVRRIRWWWIRLPWARPSPLEKFWLSGGNELLWRGLPIESRDVVLDAGGFEGDWTARILHRYGCRAIVVEPQPEALGLLRKRFNGNDRVRVVEGALHQDAGRGRLSLQGNASSLFRDGDPSPDVIEVDLVPVSDVLPLAGEHGIGCLKLNIEGGEFGILEDLVASGRIREIRCLLVQFHPWVEGAEERRLSLHRALGESHTLVFCFPMIWERWDLKPPGVEPSGPVRSSR
jgi:FkbM family methyltransferase